jgi:hypothetical protein
MARNTRTATPTEEVAEIEVEEVITFSAKQVAAELDLDAKSFRRWLRAHTTDRANKGGRWLFTAEEKADLLEAYRRTPAEDPIEDLEVD